MRRSGASSLDEKSARSGIHGNPGPGKRLPVFTTGEYTPELDRDIGFWAGYHGVNLEKLPETEKAEARTTGSTMAPVHATVGNPGGRGGDFRVNAWVK